MSEERAGPLWQLSATELIAAYGRGTTTPQEVLAATLERVEEVNPRLNALITLNGDGARAAATASTERWRAGQARGPLDGVPITIKDSLLVAGLRATWGSPLYADHVPQTDETPVARLREAGALIQSKCTTGNERRIPRWEHEQILEAAQRRLDENPKAMRARRETVEHPFGTLKMRMGATHFLMKRLPKVATEMALHVLAYNLTRVMNIIGVQRLLAAMRACLGSRQGPAFA